MTALPSSGSFLPRPPDARILPYRKVAERKGRGETRPDRSADFDVNRSNREKSGSWVKW